MSGMTPTLAANALRQEWTGDFKRKANEEMVIAGDFDRPEGVTKNEITKQLNVRILPTLSVTDVGDGSEYTNLTYDSQADLVVSGTPLHGVCPVQIPDTVVVRMVEGESAAYKKAKRDQILAGLDEYIDEKAGILFASLSNMRGAPSNLDWSLICDVHGTLLTNGKEHIKGGQTKLHLKYHPSQAKYLNAIPQVMEARMRGSVNEKAPTQTGVVLEALGMSLAETGNCYQSAGVTYNGAFAKSAFMYAKNLAPRIKEPQVFEGVVRFIGQVEFVVFEVFDEDGVGLRTPA